MKSYSFFEKYFLKKRSIFYYNLDEYSGNNHLNNIQSLSLVDQYGFANISISDRLKEYIEKRDGKDSWRLFLFVEDNKVLGYSFLHLPSKTEWNDSLPTYKDEARESSTYVEECARGRGIRGVILISQKRYCLEHGKKMWCVIEDINESSIKSTKKSGIILTRKNYLVKFLGRNIFSILKNPFKVFLLLGEKRAKR